MCVCTDSAGGLQSQLWRGWNFVRPHSSFRNKFTFFICFIFAHGGEHCDNFFIACCLQHVISVGLGICQSHRRRISKQHTRFHSKRHSYPVQLFLIFVHAKRH